MTREVAFEQADDNVYHDLGISNPVEMDAKASLVMAIKDEIIASGLTQQKAADIIGMTQPELSNVLRGRFRGVSQERLLNALRALGHPIKIIIGARDPLSTSAGADSFASLEVCREYA
jgi:predicted XRE-type DNA-binding protein